MATVNFVNLKKKGGWGGQGDSSSYKFETVGYKAVKAEGWRSIPLILTRPKPSPGQRVRKRRPPTMATI